jgi:hypothetical protein
MPMTYYGPQLSFLRKGRSLALVQIHDVGHGKPLPTLGLCREHCIPDLRRSLVFDS